MVRTMGCKGPTKSTERKGAAQCDEGAGDFLQASYSSPEERSSSRLGQSAKAAENGADLASLPKLGPRKALVLWNVLREFGFWQFRLGTVALAVIFWAIYFVFDVDFEVARGPAVPRPVVIGR